VLSTVIEILALSSGGALEARDRTVVSVAARWVRAFCHAMSRAHGALSTPEPAGTHSMM